MQILFFQFVFYLLYGVWQMELIFPIAAHILLFFSWKGVGNTHLWFGFGWTVLAQTASRLYLQPYSLSVRLGVSKILGEDADRTSDPNWTKSYSIPYGVCSAIKTRRSETGRQGSGICYYDNWLPGEMLCALKPCFQTSGWTSPAVGK